MSGLPSWDRTIAGSDCSTARVGECHATGAYVTRARGLVWCTDLVASTIPAASMEALYSTSESQGMAPFELCSDDVLLACAASLLDLFDPRPAAALAGTCRRFHRLLNGQLSELCELRKGARRLATDAGGLVGVLTGGFTALRNASELYRSAGFGGYCFKAPDAQLIAKLCCHGAFADAPRGVRLDMSMGHLGAVGAKSLAEAVGAGLVLRELHLDDAHLTNGGCITLASALGAGRSRVRLLESLSLRHDGIGDAGAAALASF